MNRRVTRIFLTSWFVGDSSGSIRPGKETENKEKNDEKRSLKVTRPIWPIRGT